MYIKPLRTYTRIYTGNSTETANFILVPKSLNYEKRTQFSFNCATSGFFFSPADYVSQIEVADEKVLKVEPEALTMLAEQAMIDIAHLLRPGHLEVREILSFV